MRRTCLATTGLLLVLAAPALACGKNGCTETSTGTAPANGALVTSTDTIPPAATEGSYKIEPLPGTDPHDFDGLTAAVVESFPWTAKNSKYSQAVLGCALLSYLPIANTPVDQPITYEHVERQVMLLNICLRMAQSLKQAPARAAASGCGQIAEAVTVKITRTSSGYTGTVAGKLHKPGRSGLRVSCRRQGKGFVVKVRPRKRGQTLRKAAGPKLAIAYQNSSSRPVGIRTTFKLN